MSEADEGRIVQAVLAGDPEAFGVLVVRHQKAIYNLMYRLCGSREDAADLTQETFLKAFEKLDQFQRDRRFFPWLYSIGLNQARDWGRRRKIRGVVTARDMDYDLGPADPAEPGEGIEDKLDLSRLARAVGRLPLEYREAVVLRYKTGLSMVEIAEIMGLSVSGAKMRVHRGLRRLRRLLEEEEDGRKDGK
ncbi:MAG: RNA polymerase sigma factor [Thermodesulfobacteriota bacterium]